MKQFAILGSIVLVAGSAIGANAADLAQPAASVAPAVSEVRGVIEVGGLGEYVTQTDDTFSGWAPGAYVSAAVSGGSDGFVWGVDGFAERNNFKADFSGDGATEDEAPLYV